MHSNRSDGRKTPAYVAASCRRIGLDFMALTDHGLYPPSLEAQNAFCLDKLGLKIFPGEEVHAPDNHVHIINFAGKFSVNELHREPNYNEYREQAESNTLQVARYHEERAKGRKIPIVGVTDAHGCEGGEFFGWYYTLVLSPSNEAPELITSIKDLYSVAVEAMPEEFPRIHGPYRLIKFAYFCLRELFAEHDEQLSREEGLLMLEHLKDDASA